MNIKESTYIYRKEHSKKTYEQINLLSRREDRLKDLIAYAAKRKGTTSQRYMKQAIKAQLQLDGITIDSLPPAAPPPSPDHQQEQQQEQQQHQPKQEQEQEQEQTELNKEM